MIRFDKVLLLKIVLQRMSHKKFFCPQQQQTCSTFVPENPSKKPSKILFCPPKLFPAFGIDQQVQPLSLKTLWKKPRIDKKKVKITTKRPTLFHNRHLYESWLLHVCPHTITLKSHNESYRMYYLYPSGQLQKAKTNWKTIENPELRKNVSCFVSVSMIWQCKKPKQ